jgi:Secretion system C-terminal sorting domain/Metallo-peptidase family M12B Reprolysin-like
VISLTAQSNAFSIVSPYVGLDTDQTKVLNFANNLPHIGNVEHINWLNDQIVGSDGKIRITLPGENGGQPIVFDFLDSYFASETEYAVFGRSSLGEIAVYVTPQGKGGTIDLANSAYAFFPLGANKGLLIKGSPGNSSEVCGVDNSFQTPAIPTYCDTDCDRSLLDVLAMVTPGASQWLYDNFGIFGLNFLFQETVNINGALINSNVTNKRVRVQIIDYTPTFQLTNDMENDIITLSASPDAQQVLQSSGADVGVLLTYEPAYFPYGIANSLDPTSTNKFCIAQVEQIGYSHYTFAHEVAHQIGCMHSDQVNPNNPTCPHGKNLISGKKTMMAVPSVDFAKILHFSNPNVFYNNESTGSSVRNNAAQIRGAMCEVANNNNPVLFSVDFSHTPASVGCPFTATANITNGLQQINQFLWNCGTNYTYQWAWSTNNTTWLNFGSNSPILDLPASPPACPVFWLRLTVTTPIGCNKVYKKLLVCDNLPCVLIREDHIFQETEVFEYNRVIPNPADNSIEVLLEHITEVNNVMAINSQGELAQDLKILDFSNGKLQCDVSGLPSGIWFLNINGSEKNVVLKFVIAR